LKAIAKTSLLLRANEVVQEMTKNDSTEPEVAAIMHFY
jgi:hypothetical protein